MQLVPEGEQEGAWKERKDITVEETGKNE